MRRVWLGTEQSDDSTSPSIRGQLCVGSPATWTLRDVKWELRKQDQWFQQDGTSWHIRHDAGADSEGMLMELASCLQPSMW